jgi:hypothetical protein
LIVSWSRRDDATRQCIRRDVGYMNGAGLIVDIGYLAASPLKRAPPSATPG